MTNTNVEKWEFGEIITIYESEPDGIRVIWDTYSGAVKVEPDGDWLLPEVSA